MSDNILLYEELSLNAYPAPQTQIYDGWVLRFANGGYAATGGRVNSINLIYPSTIDLREKIAECERRYFARGFPAVFKITEAADLSVDELLEQENYEIDKSNITFVMEMDLKDKEFEPADCVITDCAGDKWLNSYFSLSQCSDIKRTTTAQIFRNVRNTMICGRIVRGGASVACGVSVIERGYTALLNLVVDESRRGKGYGAEICSALLSAAKDRGAHTAYLQVVRDNHAAINLYTKLGYKTIYSYWYRVRRA